MYHTRLAVTCSADYAEILMAEIAEAGFDTFLETDEGFEAFVEGNNFDQSSLQSIKAKYEAVASIRYEFSQIEKKNWNEEWERNYEPIDVDGRCLIRAEFHIPEKKWPFEIVITPKMSFGTGHHQTTYLMIRTQLDLDHKGKRVMDAGCGTAILSIMASKRGAEKVEAFDIDEWSVTNGNENITLNQCSNISIRQGKITDFSFSDSFDIILANINKNVLLDEMHHYAAALTIGGKLLLSGFYRHDIEDLTARAGSLGMVPIHNDERDNWACLLLEKRG